MAKTKRGTAVKKAPKSEKTAEAIAEKQTTIPSGVVIERAVYPTAHRTETDILTRAKKIKGKRNWKATFLEYFKLTGNVAYAARETGVYRTHVYTAYHKDKEFAKKWDDAEKESTELLEYEAIRRGAIGVDEPVFQGGVLVGYVTKFSDNLLITLLKARLPEKYKDRSEVETRNVDAPVSESDVDARLKEKGIDPESIK